MRYGKHVLDDPLDAVDIAIRGIERARRFMNEFPLQAAEKEALQELTELADELKAARKEVARLEAAWFTANLKHEKARARYIITKDLEDHRGK